MSGPLYPLQFEPIFKSMLWGGRRLPEFLGRPAGTADPIGEAWVLSDVEGSESRVTNGPLAGTTLRELMRKYQPQLLGHAPAQRGRFPLLLKFIDARQELSVQVHPNDSQAHARRPGLCGKTEAWVVLDADPRTSRIYAGFKAGVSGDSFRAALRSKTVPDTLHHFTPRPGDCVFLEAGTVHAIGANVLLFEVQQTSDITYRLYDWDRVDAKTGKPRDLHIEDGLACANFAKGPCDPEPVVADGRRERLAACEYFTMHRTRGDNPLTVGVPGRCSIVVCLGGSGTLGGEPLKTGGVVLLPAAVGTAEVHPRDPLTLLECGLPEG